MLIVFAFLLIDAWAEGAPRFVEPPVATHLNKGGVRIAFTVDRETDVRVDVVGATNGVVRHVAAGRLGAVAPAPFKSGSLAQEIVWDGCDDAGQPVSSGQYSIRVGAGTRAVFDHVIGRRPEWLAPIHALATGPNGDIYVYWNGGISVLDREGAYRRQIAPAPAGLPPSRLEGLKPVRLPDGTVYFSDGYQWPGKSQYVGAMAVSPQGQVLLPSQASYSRRLARIGLDGSVSADAFETRLTQLSDVGYLTLAASPDGRYLYFAGAEAGYKGDDAREARYRQAVYRLMLDGRGPAEIWLGEDENSGEPGRFLNRPKGVTVDAKGRVYVCNYGGNNIAVYTPGGGFVRKVSVRHPHAVAVHPETGKMYVLAGEELGYRAYGYNFEPTLLEARLDRLDAEGRTEATLALDTPYARPGPTRPGGSFQLRFAADFSHDQAVLWVGVAFPHPRQCAWHLLRVEETPDGFGDPVETCPLPNDALIDPPMHLVLDRRRDILYVHDGAGKPHQSRLLRFSGDGRVLPPLLLKDADGRGEPWFFTEMAVGPDGHLYTLAWKGLWRGASSARLARFSPDGRHRPWDHGDEAPSLVKAVKADRGDTSRGLTVAPNGDIYALYYDHGRPSEPRRAWEHGWRLNTAVACFGSNGKPKDLMRIAYLRSSAQGIRVDRDGAVYVGETIRPLGMALPSELAQVLPDPFQRESKALLKDGRYDPTLRFMGSVIKFRPQGGRIDGVAEDEPVVALARPAGDVWRPPPETQWTLRQNQRVRVSGAEWQFHGFSPIPGEYQGVTHVQHCICHGGRFDLDEYGRLFAPDNLRHRVTVLDSAGNTVVRFGTYGNADTENASIGLADPWWIAAAADRVYVGDGYARRIVKVRLTCMAEARCEVSIP